MTQLDNIRSSRPMVKFPSRCGSANLHRKPRYSTSSDELPRTFLDGVNWLSRNDAMLRKFVHLMQQFPNLVDEPELHYFKLFMTEQYQDRVNKEQEKAVERILQSPHGRREPSTYNLLTPEKIEVYVSGEVNESQWTDTDYIARELAYHHKIQTDPPLPRYPGFTNEEDLVTSCNVMVFVLTETSLNDPFCIHQLKVAISRHVPVVLIREPEGIEMSELIIRNDSPIILSRPVTALTDIADQTPVLFLDDSTVPPSRDENRGVNKSLERIKKEKETVSLQSITLSEWLANELPSALLFSFEHRSVCMGKILTRIKSMALGEVLFDGYGNSLPTELPTSPKQLDELEDGHAVPDFHNSKIADMADSLRASPTSSLWGAIPSCGKCGQSVQLPDRLSMSTPRPYDPTLSKYLHHSQRKLNQRTKSEITRPSTAPSNLQSSRKHEQTQTTNSLTKSPLTKSPDDHDQSPGSESRPSSARSVTFSDTDQVVEFTSQVVEFDE